ncbi:hypothetical protein MWN33_16460 [Starkeya koreensis]|uniref:YqaE/Pmp3 family membrane protein n=1 Tax=Ancylobacter koreensis TaxID=266121 RepID=A0ABT0DQS0_9HYPH|nr:hypothetical protein [Ancylobacter koreensis]MCK0209626.1 hypothetical protein [Ancylobacter koreensis]
MMLRLLGMLFSLVLPPVGVYLVCGVGLSLYASIALTLLALAVFFGLFAGPGLALFILAILHAFACTLLCRRRATAS